MPEPIKADRRARLIAAMVEAVARHGYPSTTISRLVALARISKTDFYDVFASKEECFWATFEDCMQRSDGGVVAALAGAAPGRDQFIAVIECFAEMIATEPAVVSLVLVDSLALGPEADDPRTRSQERFEAMLRAGVEAAGGRRLGMLRARGIVVGLRRLAYRAIRDGDATRLRRGAPLLTDWVLDCATLPPADVKVGRTRAAAGDRGRIPLDEPPASELSRSLLRPRERIMRACVQLMVEQGDKRAAVPPIPAISARAGTANQTLYQEFGGKQGAVLAAFDMAIEPTLAAAEAALAATDGNTEAQVAAAMTELRRRLAGEPLLRDLAFRALPRVGSPGLERLDVAIDRIARMLMRAASVRRGTRRELRLQATAGGLWGMMRFAATADGGGRSVPTKDLVDFALIGLREPYP